MTRNIQRWSKWAAALAVAVVATTAAAGGDLKRLPGDYVLPRGEGSPGAVTFSHATHVDTAKPSCVTCHPSSFRILEAGRTRDGQPIVHARMEKGDACGSCHGKAAFGFDTCDNCHK